MEGERLGIMDWGTGANAEKKISLLEGLSNLNLSIIDVGGGKEKEFPGKFDVVSTVVSKTLKPAHLAEGFVWFSGDINEPDVWRQVEEYVQTQGKFDLSICTHVLEDVRNPLFCLGETQINFTLGTDIVPI